MAGEEDAERLYTGGAKCKINLYENRFRAESSGQPLTLRAHINFTLCFGLGALEITSTRIHAKPLLPLKLERALIGHFQLLGVDLRTLLSPARLLLYSRAPHSLPSFALLLPYLSVSSKLHQVRILRHISIQYTNPNQHSNPLKNFNHHVWRKVWWQGLWQQVCSIVSFV